MARTLTSRESLYQKNSVFISGKQAPVVRLDVNGQNGLTTDFRTLNAMTLYVKQNVLCFLLEAPRGFLLFGESTGTQMVTALKALVETQAETIDGLDASIKAEYVQVAAGASEQMDAFVRTTRERSEPTFKWTERYGLAIQKFFNTWLTMLMGDPITGVPGVVGITNFANGTQTGLRGEVNNTQGNANYAYILSPEMISATMLFVEPDATMTYPVKAFLCTNMMPDNSGDYVASMDKTSGGDKLEITVKFTCMQEVNRGVMNLASTALAAINKGGINSYDRRAYLGDTYDTTASSAIRGAKIADNNRTDIDTSVGYVGQANAIANTENQKNMVNAVADTSL